MNRAKTTRTGQWSIALALFTAVAGIIASLYMHAKLTRAEADTARVTADMLRQHTEQELQLFVDVLESVRALHALSSAINQEAMDEFIEKGLVHQHEVLGTFGLIQQISPELRTSIETKPRPGPGAYEVVQKHPEGGWVSAANRPAYYPLTWQSHANGLVVPIGFDFGSEPAIRNTIANIARTRKTQLVTTPLENAPSTFWVLSPVMPTDAPQFIIGFAVAILHPKQLVESVTALSVHNPQLRLIPSDAPVGESIHFADRAWHIRQSLNAVGTRWIFECSLPTSAVESRSTAALAFGLIVTTLLSALIALLAGRTRRIETEVQMRTEELRLANQQLEENISERALMEEEMSELSAREQRRIGRDLHDSLGQKLTGAVFLSRSLLNHLQPAGGDPHTHASTLNDTLKDAVSQVRNMARGLASVTLNEESLEESIDQLAEEMSALYNTHCTVEHSAPLPELPRKTKEQIYFIAREAVNNAARHATPTSIHITLSGTQTSWSLRVEDDGSGLPEHSRRSEGMGLRIMRHRAVRIGAKLIVQSTPGHGTVVEVSGIASA